MPTPVTGHADAQVLEALRAFPFTVPTPIFRGGKEEDFLRTLVVERTGVIWCDALFYTGLQQAAPAAMTDLCRQTRVWLMRSRQLPPATPPALGFDSRGVARRVARDIASGALLKAPTPPIIDSTWRSRVNRADGVTPWDSV